MLLGNYSVLNRNPIRYLGGGTATPEVNHVASFYRGGARKNRQYVDQTTAGNKQFSLPYGSYPPVMSLLPQRGGDLSARRSADFRLTPTATGISGMPATAAVTLTFSATNSEILPLDTTSPLRTGSSTITFTVNGDGQLISSGTGSASLTFTVADALLTASISGVGTASFTVSANNPLLGAIADGAGSSSFTITFATATIRPLIDASPLRNGTASFAVTGTLTPYAIGSMSGSTIGGGTMTEASIAASVWSAAVRTLTSGGGGGGGATAAEIRTELAPELARIDAPVSSRATIADIFAAV